MKSEVYNQSACLVNAAAYNYYYRRMTNSQIAKDLNISQSTVSRLLKRAETEKIITFQMEPKALKCIELSRMIQSQYGLKDVLVTPTKTGDAPETVKKQVALEGARYLQRIISDDDIIGLAWGGTMYHLIQYLNPCRKKNARIVTLHGSIVNCNPKFEVDTLVKRAAMAFGGKRISLNQPGIISLEDLTLLKATRYYKQIQHIFEDIDISISGVGSFYPKVTSPLATALSEREIDEAKNQHAVCDFLMHLLNASGNECETHLKDKTYSIDLNTYRKIPKKIVVASGAEKTHAIRALLHGRLVDVLIVDQNIAEKLVN